MNNLEKIVTFTPAYDKRDPNPAKDYGIGTVRCLMVLKGKEGAVHFVFSTGMLLEKTVEEYIKDGRARYELTEFGHYYLNKPMAYDIGYHSHTPRYEGQNKSEKCPHLNGKDCYCDGSGLDAQKYFDTLLSKGSDEVWKMMEEYYKRVFLEQKNPGGFGETLDTFIKKIG